MRTLIVIVALGLFTCGAAVGEEVIQPVHPGSSGGFIDHFYTHNRANVGQYPGRLICLSQDLTQAPPSVEKCGVEGYVYALSLMSGAKIYPLLSGSAMVDERLRAPGMLGQEVVVDGKFYPNTGIILADKIYLESEKPEVGVSSDPGEGVRAGDDVEPDADAEPEVDLE